MSEYIVFKTEDWPLVISSLRARYDWKEKDFDRAVNIAIELLESNKPDLEKITRLLKDAVTAAQPNPQNIGKWFWSVDVAEAYAAEVKIIPADQELTAVQKAVLTELKASLGWRPFGRREKTTGDEEREHAIKLAHERDLLGGMRAFNVDKIEEKV